MIQNPAHVLWTGGWDSTFRVLQLVVEHERRVQPHYIVDPDRRSLLNEQRAIRAIRRELGRSHPQAAERIQPLRLVGKYDIPPDPAIAGKLRSLRRRAEIFAQYGFLARYADYAGIGHLELCLHASDHRPFAVLRDHVEHVRDESGGYWQVDRLKTKAGDDLAMFMPFRLPLLGMNKVQMAAAAQELGVLKIMDLTWFCFRPLGRFRDQPCGLCPPCVDAVQGGMRHRLHGRTMVNYHLRVPWRMLRDAYNRVRALRGPT